MYLRDMTESAASVSRNRVVNPRLISITRMEGLSTLFATMEFHGVRSCVSLVRSVVRG